MGTNPVGHLWFAASVAFAAHGRLQGIMGPSLPGLRPGGLLFRYRHDILLKNLRFGRPKWVRWWLYV